MQNQVSDLLNSYIESMFDASDRDKARALLFEITSSGSGNQAPNRCEVAALKISGGTIYGLRRAVRMYHTDFRDLLMAAGFGHDNRAHEAWEPDTN